MKNIAVICEKGRKHVSIQGKPHTEEKMSNITVVIAQKYTEKGKPFTP